MDSHRRIEPATSSANIQSIAAKYFTPPAMDYIPLSNNQHRPVRPSWAEVAGGPGRRTTGRRHNGGQAMNSCSRPAVVGHVGIGARFATSLTGHRPDFQFGGLAPPPGQVFQFTGRSGPAPTPESEPTETMYSGIKRNLAITIDSPNVRYRYSRGWGGGD